MVAEVTLTARGFQSMIRKTDALSKYIDSQEVAVEVGAILLDRTRKRFLDAVDPDGNQWEPSQASIRRQQSGRGGKTLFDTGRLFQSIQLSARGPGQSSIGTDVPYARKHQFGEDGNLQRVFLGFGDEDERAVEVFLTARLGQVFGGA